MARPPEIAETQLISNDQEHQEFLDLTQNLTRITKAQAKKKQGQHDFIPEEPSPSEASSSSPSKRAGEPVPHYLSDTQYIQNKTFRRLFGLSIFFSFVYFALRVVYIAMGKVKVAVPADSSAETLREVDRQNRAALVYSTIILCAELGGFILVHVGQQMFTRQKTKFTRMPDLNVERMKQVVVDKGTLQNIHVIVCTYSEDAATVEKCVVHLLEATLPVYATRTIWVADDGHNKPSGPGKRASCEKLAAAGHNVRYVGDRKRRTNQLNGKSSNLNHILLSHIYPDVNHSNEVSWKDIIVVMDCDHLVTPAYFQKCCSVLLNKDVAVCLVPQAFHNLIKPDFFDNRNANFMFRLMPYYFGAGCCFITGTNVMIRARTCFLACQFGEVPTQGKRKFLHLWREKQANKRTRQLFSEVLIAEDIDLGSRIHALGYKSVFLDEVLALGEVPHAPRDFWKQRSRWHKAAHLYILDRHSVFWRTQPYMTFYQKSLYCIPMILHITVFLSEPFMFTLPLVCLCFGVCPYGMDIWLWATHFLKLLFNFLISTHADKISGRVAALQAQTASRVLYFVSVKAIINTIMVYIRWKRPGAFKVTKKAGTDSRSDVQSQSEIPCHSRAPSEAYSAHSSHPSQAPSRKYSNYSRPPSMQHMHHGAPSGHKRSYSGNSQHQGHLVTAQERARRASSNRSSVAGALAEGNERHLGPGNRGRMYGQSLTQDYVGTNLRSSKGSKLANRDRHASSFKSRDQKPPLRDPRSPKPVRQEKEQPAKQPQELEEGSVNGDSNPGLSGWTGPQVSPYEELMDGMTVGTDTTLETQATPVGMGTQQSSQNMFGTKPSPLGSPLKAQHAAASAHADLQTLSHSGSQQQSTEVAPNPDYSPRERLASTSMLEDQEDSPPARQAPPSAFNRPAGGQVRNQRNLPLEAVNSEALGATYESCTSAASVAFASKSLARHHPGVMIPQSQGNTINEESSAAPAPPTHPQHPSEAINVNSEQHSVTEDYDAPLVENRAANPSAPARDVEAAVDRTSADIEHTASVEITPSSHLNAGAASTSTAQQERLNQNGATHGQGNLQRQGSLPNQGSINRTNSAPKRRHHFGAPDNNTYVPPEQQQACDSFVESIGNHPRTPSLVSMGSMNGVPQPADVVSIATAPAAYDVTSSTAHSRAQNSASEAASCVVPVPPPGFQYALVPTAPVGQPPPQNGVSGAQVQGILAAQAHVPTTLAAVQEGHPMQPHELHRDVGGSPAKSSITGSQTPTPSHMNSSEGEFSSGFGMNSSTVLPPPRMDQRGHSPQHNTRNTGSPVAVDLPNQPLKAGALSHSPPSGHPPAHAHTFHADNNHVTKGTSFRAHMPQHNSKARTYDGNTETSFPYPSRQSSKAAMHMCEGQMETDCHAYNVRVDTAPPSQYRNKARTYDSGAGGRYDYPPPRRPTPATYDANGERGGSMHAASFRSEGARNMKAPSFNGQRPSQTNNDVTVPVAGSQMAGPVAEDQDDAAPPPGYNCGFYCCHDALSNITEKRKACMPYDGTLDFPVLFIVTAMNLVALIYGTVNLAREGEIISLRGTEEQNVKMIALVFALVEVTPGFLFLWYMVSFRCCKWTLWIVVPFTITLVALLVAFIEIRVGLQYITTALGINWQLPECTLSKCDVLGGGASKQA